MDWQYINPTTLLGNHGREINLVEGEPKLLQKKLEDTLGEQHEKQLSEAVLKMEETTETEKELIQNFGIDFEATRKALRSQRTTRRSNHIITQLAAGAYPMGKRLLRIGVKAFSSCPFAKRQTIHCHTGSGTAQGHRNCVTSGSHKACRVGLRQGGKQLC